jgi:hypothetical protein
MGAAIAKLIVTGYGLNCRMILYNTAGSLLWFFCGNTNVGGGDRTQAVLYAVLVP